MGGGHLQVVDHVAQSYFALQLLLPQADYAAALDIIADIQVSTSMSLYRCGNALGTYLLLEAGAQICFLLAAFDRHAPAARLYAIDPSYTHYMAKESTVSCNVPLVSGYWS